MKHRIYIKQVSDGDEVLLPGPDLSVWLEAPRIILGSYGSFWLVGVYLVKEKEKVSI